MRIVICGAGHVGSFAAEALAAARHSITVVDIDADRVRDIGDRLDVAVLTGDCAQAATLEEAGVRSADLLLAATQRDEVNLLAASIAKGMGAHKTVARVRLGSFYDDRRFGYARHLGIDRLICPEYATSEQIAADVLGLTKLNYNACRLGDALPVTIKFSDMVGEILISNPTVEHRRPNFKFYI